MTPQQIASVDALKIESAEFTIMRQLAMRFRGLLMGGSIEKLDAWLHDAQLSGIYAMQRFARVARQDFDAVRNAVLEPWSNGQTEGEIKSGNVWPRRHRTAPRPDDSALSSRFAPRVKQNPCLFG